MIHPTNMKAMPSASLNRISGAEGNVDDLGERGLSVSCVASIVHKTRGEVAVPALAKWTCPGCGKRRTSAYCPACGEEPLRPRDLKIDDLATRIAAALSSVDGKLLRSFRVLLASPGTLTKVYVAGQRRSYIGPLQLFLIANALFFAVQTWTHLAIFSSPLESHLHHQDWQDVARQMTAARLQTRHETLAAFAPVFDRAALLNAKALIILMALAFWPLLPLFYFGARRSFGAHLLFAIHLYTFTLLLMCVSMLLSELDLLFGGEGLASGWVDTALSLFNLTACAIYIHLAAGTFYGSRGWPRIVKAVLLSVVLGAIALGYRFTIFVITLYTA
jgi:hypothetical protein